MARVTAQRLLAILLDAPPEQQPATFIPCDSVTGSALYQSDITWSNSTISGLSYQALYGSSSMLTTGTVGTIS